MNKEVQRSKFKVQGTAVDTPAFTSAFLHFELWTLNFAVAMESQ